MVTRPERFKGPCYPVIPMSWMAWTPVTACFFLGIALLLAGMTAWEIRRPCLPRRGLLPLVTSRGDRLFIGLNAAAWLFLAWIGFTSASPAIALPFAAALVLAIGRWG